jgi:hypothetical protein
MKAPRNFSPNGYQSPQYAEFETGKKNAGGEDALPAMPSWEGASSKKVMMEEEAVEMNNLQRPEASMAGAGAGTGTGVVAGALPGPSNSLSGGRLTPNGQMPYRAQSPYAGSEQGYAGYNAAGYRQPSTSPGPDVAYAAAGAIGMVPGRSSPYNNGHDHNQPAQGYQRSNSPQTYGAYGQPGYDAGYGAGSRSESPANAYHGHPRLSPSPQATGYGSYAQTQYSQNGAYNQQGYSSRAQHLYSPEPVRQQESFPQELPAQPVEPRNAQGFNFDNSSNTRPQETDYVQPRESPKIAQPVPQGSNAYPGGYRSYQPPNSFN